MSTASFLKKFKKDVEKMSGVSTDGSPPKFWISTGNYVINKVISGDYTRGIAQGRMASLAGPSGAGKSFIAGNIIRSAQEQGCSILIVDSENALDDEYMEAIGVDVSREDYIYTSCNRMAESNKIIASFLKDYRDSKCEDKFLIVMDSIDMLQTDADAKNYDKQEVKGDQGQHAKQSKKLLAGFMHDIKDLNVAVLCTKQVYAEQDMFAAMNFPWKFTESIKFVFSQIVMVTRKHMKDKATKKFEGIELQVFGFKTRFTKPYQKCFISVPYDTGLDPYSGILDAALSFDIVTKSGSWYTYKDKKFQESNFDKYQEEIFQDLLKVDGELDVGEDDYSDIDTSSAITEEEMVKKRRSKGKKSKDSE